MKYLQYSETYLTSPQFLDELNFSVDVLPVPFLDAQSTFGDPSQARPLCDSQDSNSDLPTFHRRPGLRSQQNK